MDNAQYFAVDATGVALVDKRYSEKDWPAELSRGQYLGCAGADTVPTG